MHVIWKSSLFICLESKFNLLYKKGSELLFTELNNKLFVRLRDSFFNLFDSVHVDLGIMFVVQMREIECAFEEFKDVKVILNDEFLLDPFDNLNEEIIEEGDCY